MHSIYILFRGYIMIFYGKRNQTFSQTPSLYMKLAEKKIYIAHTHIQTIRILVSTNILNYIFHNLRPLN